MDVTLYLYYPDWMFALLTFYYPLLIYWFFTFLGFARRHPPEGLRMNNQQSGKK